MRERRLLKKAMMVFMFFFALLMVGKHDVYARMGSADFKGYRDMTWPVPGHYNLSSCFFDDDAKGVDRSDYHYALDIFTGSTDANVVAAYAGTVVEIVNNGNGDGGFGNQIVIKHSYKTRDGNTRTLYTHYSHLYSYSVRTGQSVTAGQVIGKTGGTGYGTVSYGVHLDFQILTSSEWRNYKNVSKDPYATEMLSLPSNICKGGSTACCDTYISEVKALYAQPIADVKPTISGSSYPSTLSIGSSFQAKGTISASTTITWVWVGVQYGDTYSHALETYVNPTNTATYDISKISGNLNFASLSAGDYTFQIDVIVAGQYYTLVRQPFKVVAKPDTPKLSISSSHMDPTGSVSISWNKVENAASYVIDGYLNGQEIIWRNVGNVTSYTFSNLSEGKYVFFIIASNNGINSDSSNGVTLNVSKEIGTADEKAVASGSYNGHLYEAYDYSMKWTEAKAFCERKGGHLVTITDEGENNFVKTLINGNQKGLYYIGCTDVEKEGTWKWITGEPFTYSNWDPQAPEPNGGTKENYGVMVSKNNPPNKQSGEWCDTSDQETGDGYYNYTNIGFVCEYEETTTDLSDCAISIQGKQTYDGTEKEPSITVKLGNVTLTRNKDYTVSYSNNVNAGNALVTVTGIGEYSGEAEKTFVIEKADQKMVLDTLNVMLKENSSIELTLKCVGDYVASCDSDIATVIKGAKTDSSGEYSTSKFTIKGIHQGKGIVTVVAGGNSNYNRATNWIVVNVEHDYQKGEKLEPTCTTAGYQEYVCSACEQSYKEIIAATGHKYQNTVVPPTCTVSGYTVHTCSICGDTYKDQYITPKGHTWGNAVVTKEPTCTEKGRGTYTCSCGASYSDDIPVIGHDYVETERVEPTCLREGYITYECTRCHDTKQEVLQKVNQHHWDNGQIVSNSTCTRAGQKKYTCTICGTARYEDLKAKGHTFGNMIVTVQPTVNSKGMKERRCTVCGYRETYEIPAITATGNFEVTNFPLQLKKSYTLKVNNMAAGDRVVSWKSSNTKIATVTGGGKITGKKNGKVTITAVLSSGKVLNTKVTVKKKVNTSKVTVNGAKTITLRVKQGYQIKAVRFPVTSQQALTYSSSSKKVATVNKKGWIMAKKAGKATITVKSGSKKVKITVKVTK